MSKSRYVYKIFLASILLSVFLSYEISILIENIKKLETLDDHLFLRRSAKEIYTQCGGLGQNSSPCYLEQFEAFTKKYSLKTAVAVLLIVQDFDGNTKNCHLIAHTIASTAGKKSGHSWQKLLQSVDPYFCTAGFIHGVLESAVSLGYSLFEDDSPDLLCATAYHDEFSRNACIHAIGHVVLTETYGDISGAVSICSKIKDETVRHNCFAGVFMENIERLNLETHGIAARIPPSREFAESVENVCKSLSSEPQHACWQELPHLYLRIYGDDPASIFQACARASEKAMARSCYMHASGMMAVTGSISTEELNDICRQYDIENPLYQRCVYSVIDALLISSPKLLNRAVILCEHAPSFLQNWCFARINDGVRKYTVPINGVRSAL